MQARADLANRLGISADAILTDSIEPVRWPDACLGLSGENCATVVTPGYRIWLRAGDRVYQYRTDTLGNTVRAANGPEPATPEPTLASPTPVSTQTPVASVPTPMPAPATAVPTATPAVTPTGTQTATIPPANPGAHTHGLLARRVLEQHQL